MTPGSHAAKILAELRKIAGRIRDSANLRAGGARGGDPETRAARWVATDALRELTSAKVQTRLEGMRAATRRQEKGGA